MAPPLPPDADSFAAKTNEALRFLGGHPHLYHPDVVAAARRELRRRGVAAPAVLSELPTGEFAGAAYPAARPFPWVALGAGVLVLVVGLAVFSHNREQPRGVTRLPAGLRVTRAAAGDPLPNLDSLTQTDAARTAATLPAAEQLDSKGLRNYRQLAQRYWAAEHRATWLLDRIAHRPTPDPTLPDKLKAAREQWQALAHVLDYDLALQPAMQTRARHMARAAALRQQVLNTLAFNLQQGDSLLTSYVRARADSAYSVRAQVLGLPTVGVPPALVLRLKPDVVVARELPPHHPLNNPVYVLRGRLLASDPSSGTPPAAVLALLPADVDSVAVLRPAVALRAYGPRAHDGAVLIFTSPSQP